MITWLVILTIVILLLIACMVGMLFRSNRMQGSIERLSIALMEHKFRDK